MAVLLLVSAAQANFRQTEDIATIGYDAPSVKSNRQFIYSRGIPLEIITEIMGWTKVRDAQSTLVWIERKDLTERSNVQIKTDSATVHTSADDTSPVLFRAEGGLLLQLVAPPAAGWAQVHHRDGQTGYIRIETLFGL